MLRIGLLIATNFAVLIVASITMSLFGVDQLLMQSGAGMNLTGLLIMCAVMGFGGSFISLLMSKTIAKYSMRVRIIDNPQSSAERWLVETVAELAQKAGIKMPEVGIFPMQHSNAFATGWNKDAALVGVSEGLLARMSQEEVKAVLGHEIAHVANGDMVTLTLVQGVMNTFVFFFARLIGMIVDRVVFKNDRGLGFGYFGVMILAQVVLGFVAAMVVSWFSRYREFRADAGGADLVSTSAMIGALARLQQEQGEPVMPDTMAAFGIRKSGGGLSQLFSSHPPLDVRIQALKARANQPAGITR